MKEEKQKDLSVDDVGDSSDSTKNESESKASSKKTSPKKQPESKGKKVPSWPDFIKNSSTSEIKYRWSQELSKLLSESSGITSSYCCVALMDPESSIGRYDLDRIYRALSEINTSKEKDVLLILLSGGGTIEPAYQISKLCKSFSKDKFVVTVPRHAKSAATLIAIGADEIHMGPLGQLGPIDPQLGGLPALGVSQALESIASLSERFPGSSEMFARYLRLALTVEQIGYCDRIAESAEQYAERLLSTKPSLNGKERSKAKELVYEYKDHGFVIDFEEASQHLGKDWILPESPELDFSEKIYQKFDEVNLFLSVFKKQRLLVIGEVDTGVLIFDHSNQ